MLSFSFVIDPVASASANKVLIPPHLPLPRQSAAKDVNARIRRVEEGLLLPVSVKGEPSPLIRLSDRLRFYKTPGLSIALINNGVIEWTRGYGETESGNGKPVTATTLFQAGSISKAVTAIAVMRLVEAGKLDLDEDVNKKLASWKIPENEFTRQKKVTLRQLLSHNAGVNIPSFIGYLTYEKVPTLVQVLDGVKPANTGPIRVVRLPGSGFSYSGGGYTIVQQLLIDVEKKAFPVLMKDLLFGPLGLRHITFEQQPLPPYLAGLATAGHNYNGETPPGKWRIFPELAAAGLWATPSDLARMFIDIERSRAGRPKTFLSTASVNEMVTPQAGNWGLGFSIESVRGGPRYGHGGSTLEFNALVAIYAGSGRGVVIMTNGLRGNALMNEVLRSIAREYGWGDFQQKERTIAKIDPKVYADYLGQYQFEFSSDYSIKVDLNSGNLTTELKQPTSTSRATIYPESDTRFFRKDIDVEISFVRDQTGHVTHLILRQEGQDLRANRIN